MTYKERIVKAMKRDAVIHERGHFTAKERKMVGTTADHMIMIPTDRPETPWWIQIVAEIAEAPAK
jgi:hypothetical protein